MPSRLDPLPPSRARAARYGPGYVVGEKYTLVRQLGEGGTASVWVAHDAVLDVKVALKLVAFDGANRQVLAQRMLEEARTAARIVNPAIVRVMDFGMTRFGDPFLALELLEGEDLADLLARDRRLPPQDAVAVLLPIAHALVTAHEAGIVHRDVKPENIFLAKREVGIQPKLLDFGIARFVNRPRRLTLDGDLMGTPEYMAPELLSGAPATPASDLWSFCVVLFELITGHCPFRAEGYHDLVKTIREHEPRNMLDVAEVDPRLWALVKSGLEKAESGRPQSMRMLGQALARWLLDQDVLEDVSGTSIRHTWLRDGDPDRLSTRALGGPTSTPRSQSRLEAIASLNQGGDPEHAFARARLSRDLMVGAALVTTGLLLLAALLVAAGVLESPF